MATTITITCPHCDKQLRAPADVLGKKLRCKGCEKTFTAAMEEDEAPVRPKSAKPAKPPAAKKAPAKPPAAKAAAARKVDDDEDDDPNPYGVTHEDLGPRCPNCANALEDEESIVCLHCGYNTRTRERKQTRKVRDQTGGDIFMWLLPGIACALGVIAILTFDIVFCIKIENVSDDEWYAFFKSLGVKIWVVVPSLFVVFGLGRFAVKRLIFNNKPPEIEEKLK